MEKQKKQKSFKGISVFLSLLCLCLIVAIFYMAGKVSDLQQEIVGLQKNVSQKEEKIVHKEIEIEQQVIQINKLIAQYDEIKSERDSLGLENKDLEEKVKKLKTYLSSVEKKNTLNQNDIKKYEQLLAEFKEDLKIKDEQLVKLKSAYDTLQSTAQLQKVEMEMMTDYMVDLESKVELASILKAENVNINVINSKGKEYDGGEYKDKWVEKVKVFFNLADNKVVKKGAKELVIKLIEPSGTTLTGGGSFVDANGKTQVYTQRQVVNFDNSEQEVSFIYNKGSDYAEGNYTVEIYSDGHKIGKGTFLVK